MSIVGGWRSAANYLRDGGSGLWGWLARITLALSALQLIVSILFGFMEEPDDPAVLTACMPKLAFDIMETSFFNSRETIIPSLDAKMAYWRSLLFIALFRNAGSATAFFKIPSNRVVELGTQVVL